MRKISFLFGIHNHQPIGNFHEVFEAAYQKSYQPFAEIFLNHPKIKWNLHCTGILWEWLEKNHPEYLKKVQTMADRGQVELLSGGFYEPILPILPDADKIGQIQKLNRYLKDRFNVEPKGMWCAERVWEPHLPKPVRAAQIEYTVLDDTHFLSSGLSKQQLTGYYRVEEQNDSVDIFPISQDLRYVIPFRKPEEAIAIFKRCAEECQQEAMPAMVMADDGEKFGLWPDTYKLVYKDGWLEKFIGLLEKNSEWIQVENFSEYRERNRPLGKAFLPTASYYEMSEWSLPTESGIEFESALHKISDDKKEPDPQIKRFLKGGIWRNFLAKYPESNGMYKKMLRVSQRVHDTAVQIGKMAKSKAARNSPAYQETAKLIGKALDHLWAGQCNCSYWHGVFGGLYLPILRQAIYRNLIDAENILDAIQANGFESKNSNGNGGRIECTDFDGDGNEEIIAETRTQNLYLSPKLGGALFEWDFKPVSVNLENILTRRKEVYHEKIKKFISQKCSDQQSAGDTKSIHDLVVFKDEKLDSFLNYDWYRRGSLIDHFLHPHTDLESFKKCQYGEQGDFVLGHYSYAISRKESKPGLVTAKAKSASSGAVKASKDLKATLTLQGLEENETIQIKLFREGTVWVGDRKNQITVEKVLTFANASEEGKAELQVAYRISNLSDRATGSMWFAPEFNFAFTVPDKDKDAAFSNCRKWERIDPHHHWKMSIEFSDPADGMIFPLETVSNSEGGFEKTFQGLVFVPHWKFSLDGRQSFERKLNFILEKTAE